MEAVRSGSPKQQCHPSTTGDSTARKAPSQGTSVLPAPGPIQARESPSNSRDKQKDSKEGSISTSRSPRKRGKEKASGKEVVLEKHTNIEMEESAKRVREDGAGGRERVDTERGERGDRGRERPRPVTIFNPMFGPPPPHALPPGLPRNDYRLDGGGGAAEDAPIGRERDRDLARSSDGDRSADRRDSRPSLEMDSNRGQERDSNRVQERDSNRVQERDSNRVQERDSNRGQERDSNRGQERDSNRGQERAPEGRDAPREANTTPASPRIAKSMAGLQGQFGPDLMPARIFVGPLDPRPEVIDEDRLFEYFKQFGTVIGRFNNFH